MFAYCKQQRLLSKSDFKNLFTKSKRFKFHCFTVVVKDNAIGTSRLGISISRKVSNAVKRNRAKRLTREIFRLHCNFQQNRDCLIIIHRPLSDENRFRSELMSFFK